MTHATRWIAILPMLLWQACGASTSTPQKSEHIFVVGADVDAKGQVTQTQPDAEVAKPIAVVLDEALKHWRFVPAQKDGKAVSAHTFIKAKLEALPAANSTYSLRISFLGQGPKWEPAIPKYPEKGLLARTSGRVVIVGQLNPDGKITIIETSGDKPFVEAASTAFLYNVGIPETVDGQPVAAHIQIPFTFNIHLVSNEMGFDHSTAYNLVHVTSEENATRPLARSKEGSNALPSTPSPISSVLQPSSVDTVILQP